MISWRKFFDLMKLSLEALTERKFRATLTILMVIIGTGLLVAVNGISTGTVTYINDQFKSIGTNMLMVSPRGGDNPLDDYFVKDVLKMSGVQDVVPYYQQGVLITVRGQSMGVIAMGIDQNKLPSIFPTLKLKEGNFVSSTDSIGILVGYEVAYKSGGEVFVRLSQTVQMDYTRTLQGETNYYHKSFVVRGILDYVGSGILPLDQMVFISLKAGEKFFQKSGSYDGVFVLTKNSNLNDEVMNEIKAKYDVSIISPKSIIDVINKVENAVVFFTNNIALVSLIVAAVGIITTLWTSVLERIREIGILKAIGFKETYILLLFLNEALIIGIVGGVLGVATGISLAYVMRFMFSKETAQFVRPLFLPESLLSSFLTSIVLSIIAGIYPSWRASRLDPVVAIRHE